MGADRGANQPSVCVLVLNWNGWRDTVECLESVFQSDYQHYAVIVVDNGSQDESLAMIRKYCEGSAQVPSPFVQFSSRNKPIPVTYLTDEAVEEAWLRQAKIEDIAPDTRFVLIPSSSNRGFAGGNNLAIECAELSFRPRYVLLLNNDAVIERDLLSKLVSLAESSGEIGMVGPKICRYEDPSTTWAVGGKSRLLTGSIRNLGEGRPEQGYHGVADVDYVSGCVLLVKMDLVRAVGMLDSDYFLYFEEVDWALRAREHGYRCAVTCDAKAYHKSGSSMKGMYHYPRSKLLFLKKRVRWYLFPTFLMSFVVTYSAVMLSNASRGNFQACRNIIKAVRDVVLQSMR